MAPTLAALGYPAARVLAFFLQQAAIAGGHVPVDAALGAYHAALSAETGLAIPLAAIRRAVEAAELLSRAVYWPAYLTQAPADAVAAILRRIHDLAARLALRP